VGGACSTHWRDVNIKMDFKEVGCDDVNCIHLSRIGSSGGLL
jgi:hypothetical protein